MTGDLAELLAALEAFADDAVIIREVAGTPASTFAEKLDVLERVVELLRLHTGAMENRTEPPRVWRRLPPVRDWEHEQATEQEAVRP